MCKPPPIAPALATRLASPASQSRFLGRAISRRENSFQIDARTHGTTDQAQGARVTGAGGERRVLRDRPATHGWHAGPGETTPHSREGRGQARAIRDRLRRGVRWDKATPVLRTRRRRRASGLCQRNELGARRDAGRVPGCAVELRQAERQQVPDAGLLQRKVQEDGICPIGLFMDVQRLWVRVRDRQRVRLRPEETREGAETAEAGGSAIVRPRPQAVQDRREVRRVQIKRRRNARRIRQPGQRRDDRRRRAETRRSRRTTPNAAGPPVQRPVHR